MELDFSRPGKPTDNAFIESFKACLRQECLNENWFLSIDNARAKIECWRRHYNEERPHGSLGNLVPSEFAKSVQTTLADGETDFLAMNGTERGKQQSMEN